MAVAWALNVWATNSWVGMNGGPPNAWRGEFTPTPVPDEVQTGGKGDNGVRRTTFKPTGLLDRPKKPQTATEQRIEDSRAIAAEVAAKLASEFGSETAEILAAQQARDVAELSAQQVALEIGFLLRKKLRTEEDELLLLLLLAASE